MDIAAYEFESASQLLEDLCKMLQSPKMDICILLDAYL